MKLRKKIKVAIDSPAAAGAGTLAKLIAKEYNLAYLDTGKCYRWIANIKVRSPRKFSYKYIKKLVKKLNLKKLQNKALLNDEVAQIASVIAKNKKIRQIIYDFQKKIAYFPSKKFNGSVLDGRDITYKVIPDADFKFYVTANIKVRATRRFKELKSLNKKISYNKVLKDIKNRDYTDKNRSISRLIKTDDSILINTTSLTIRSGFLKIKKIMDNKLKNYARN